MMFAFDANILGDYWRGDAETVDRIAAMPTDQLTIPVVVIEEVLRGRLDQVRKSEAGRGRLTLDEAYDLLIQSYVDLRAFAFLSYAPVCDDFFHEWRRQGIRIGSHDLRIAAVCRAHNATLVTRNRRDFEQVPGLSVEFWD